MRFLLVLSDAFDALWAIRGRVALALAGIALLGVLVTIYLPQITGGETPSTTPVIAHNPTAQGPVERAKVPPKAASTPPSALAAAPVPAPVAAPAPQALAATDPGSAPEQAPEAAQSSAPKTAPAPEPAPASQAAAAPAAEANFKIQVGAFREVWRAQQLSRRLTRAGFPTSVVRGTTPDGKPIFRVRTRQTLPKGEARQLVARLRHRVPALRPVLVPGGGAAG
ncbi:MAG: SPOR domain-containing protein [Burkholderiales bacterium]